MNNEQNSFSANDDSIMANLSELQLFTERETENENLAAAPLKETENW